MQNRVKYIRDRFQKSEDGRGEIKNGVTEDRWRKLSCGRLEVDYQLLTKITEEQKMVLIMLNDVTVIRWWRAAVLLLNNNWL